MNNVDEKIPEEDKVKAMDVSFSLIDGELKELEKNDNILL